MRYINDIPVLFIFVSLVCYIPSRFIYLTYKKRKMRVGVEISNLALIAYVESLLYLTLFPSEKVTNKHVAINLIPFHTIKLYLYDLHHFALQMINLAGNIVVFIPIGVFAILYRNQITFPKMLLIGIGSTLFIEVMQLILSINGVISRSFDVDDLILNTFGALLGYFLGKAYWKMRRFD